MRKILDLVAVLSFLLSSSIVGGGAFVYLNRATITEAALGEIMKKLPIPAIPSGTKDLLPF
ncbi:MAG: hypothetical protein CL918_01655 [Deltaproteobacteria bacterium]|nr:hypothetical protein [Deltaproteobacteria bacterium]|tara:strand:+ start:1643 stop:1825 length:183 start_codon:yes stop_codon:yes gene_type:complete